MNDWRGWRREKRGRRSGEEGQVRRIGDDGGDEGYAQRGFNEEVNRLYGVMNNRLYDRRYLAGDDYTIADMISYPWTENWEAQGQDLDEFPYFKRWFEELGARDAVRRGMAAGSDLSVDYSTLGKEDVKRLRAMLYNQRARPAPEGGLL